MKRLTTVAAMVLLAGCTVFFTEQLPGDHRPAQPVDCTTGDTSSWADVVLAAGLGTLAYLDTTDSVQIGLGAWSAAHLLSAAGGFYWHAQCRHAVVAHRAWQRAHPAPLPAARPALPTMGHLDQACFPNRSCMAPLVCEHGTSRCRRVPERGAPGGECYPNQTCDRGARCDGATAVCISGGIGSAGAPCYPNQTCDAGLTCGASGCQAPSPP